MDQLPELREGTPEAQPEATPVRARKAKRLTVNQAWDDIGPVHTEPALPTALEDQRRGLPDGWTCRITPGQGYHMAKKKVTDLPVDQRPPEPVWNPGEKHKPPRTTVDVQVPVFSLGLRCRHVDGRRAVAVWVYRTDKEAWAFSGPAYAWMAGMDARPYECDATEWRDLVRWVPELEAAA